MIITSLITLSVLVFLALSFEFINGFHDTANAVATTISTKALSPIQAIIISALFNLIGAFSGLAVAHTIINSFAAPELITNLVLFSALCSAITWNLFTWYFGIPSSSSHALIGGLVGGVIIQSGFGKVVYKNVAIKVIAPMVISPIAGFFIASAIVILLTLLFSRIRNLNKMSNRIKDLQVFSNAFLSFSHGSNDAQKTMAIVTLILFNCKIINDTSVIPLFVIVVCAVCMSLGTLMGGVRIIKTLSTRVAKLKPINGFAAELSAATMILLGARFGFPLSTTHAVSGSIMGAGISGKLGANFNIIKNMLVAWIITMPICIVLAAVYFMIYKMCCIIFAYLVY